MSNNNECDYAFRVVIVGDQTVGKTSLLLRFVDHVFIAENVTTNGANMKSREVPFGKKTVQLNILDTCGQELFRTISRSIYHNADAVIVVYDQGNEKSFTNVQFWIREADRYTNNPKCIKLIVGNKIDVEAKRVIDPNAGREFATSLGLPFFDTSAKENTNVNSLFQAVIQGIGAKTHPTEDWTKVRVGRPESREGGASSSSNNNNNNSLSNSGGAQKGGKGGKATFCTLV